MSATFALIAGVLDLGFAAFHVLFWRLFHWPGSLAASGRTNAAITQTLNIMLTLVLALYGGWLIHAGWSGTRPDGALLACGVLFGVVRTALQPVMFGMKRTTSKIFVGVAGLTTAIHAAAMI